LVIHRGRQR